jgi:hypothetical protein
MDQVSLQPKGGDDNGSAKRLLEIEETVLPDPKRARTSGEEIPGVGSDKGFHAPGHLGKLEAKRKPQKGKQNEKNKGTRRGTRSQVEGDPDRTRTPRLSKKQCAILIGFSGTNYAGMQMYARVSPPLPHDQRIYMRSANPTLGQLKVFFSMLL